MPGRKCSICSHPRSSEITKSICDGGSKRVIADRFGVTPASVQRHRSGCLHINVRPKTAETSAPESSRTSLGDSARFENASKAISTPADLLERLRSLFRLGDLLEEAYERRDVDACVKLAREYRAAAESYARVAGWMTDGASTTINLDARRQGLTLLGKLDERTLRALAGLEDDGAIDAEIRALEA